jgi:hypothetical protein
MLTISKYLMEEDSSESIPQEEPSLKKKIIHHVKRLGIKL